MCPHPEDKLTQDGSHISHVCITLLPNFPPSQSRRSSNVHPSAPVFLNSLGFASFVVRGNESMHPSDRRI
jgi:hypothetical protein